MIILPGYRRGPHPAGEVPVDLTRACEVGWRRKPGRRVTILVPRPGGDVGLRWNGHAGDRLSHA